MKFRQENMFSGSYLYVQGEDDNAEEYKYDVTGYISIKRAFEEERCSYNMLRLFIYYLIREGTQLEEAGKNMDGWILDPTYIFINTPKLFLKNSADSEQHISFAEKEKSRRIKFIYYPTGTSETLGTGLLHLAEFIIKNIDYSDESVVNLAYDFYLKIYHGNYVFNDLLQ